jgi:hypothetical protein
MSAFFYLTVLLILEFIFYDSVVLAGSKVSVLFKLRGYQGLMIYWTDTTI